MQTLEQVVKMTIDQGNAITGLKHICEALSERMDKNDMITQGIHELSANMKSLAGEVKRLVDREEQRAREQGKRLGEVESIIIRLANIEGRILEAMKLIDALYGRIEKIEQEPGNRWRAMITQITGMFVAALIGFVISRIM